MASTLSRPFARSRRAPPPHRRRRSAVAGGRADRRRPLRFPVPGPDRIGGGSPVPAAHGRRATRPGRARRRRRGLPRPPGGGAAALPPEPPARPAPRAGRRRAGAAHGPRAPRRSSSTDWRRQRPANLDEVLDGLDLAVTHGAVLLRGRRAVGSRAVRRPADAARLGSAHRRGRPPLPPDRAGPFRLGPGPVPALLAGGRRPPRPRLGGGAPRPSQRRKLSTGWRRR